MGKVSRPLIIDAFGPCHQRRAVSTAPPAPGPIRRSHPTAPRARQHPPTPRPSTFPRCTILSARPADSHRHPPTYLPVGTEPPGMPLVSPQKHCQVANTEEALLQHLGPAAADTPPPPRPPRR